MTAELSTVIVLSAVGLVGLAAWVLRKSSSRDTQEAVRLLLENQKNSPALLLMQNEVAGLRQELRQSLADNARLVSESQKTIGDRLERASDVVARVQKSLGSLEHATAQVFAVGKDIAQLQDILRAPKLRG